MKPRRRTSQDAIVRQPRHTSDELAFAKRTLRNLVRDSAFFPAADDDGDNHRVGTLREDEVDVGRLVGRGGFCEVRAARRRPGSAGRGGGGARYAMKYLRPKKTEDSRVFQRGIADLAIEARFLSLLRHDHIIGLHYVSEGSLEENCGASRRREGRGDDPPDDIAVDARGDLRLRRREPSPPDDRRVFGYFLLLDPLHETLADRIDRAYIPQALATDGGPRPRHGDSYSSSLGQDPRRPPWDQIRRDRGRRGDPAPGDAADPAVQLATRLGALQCVASALQYLHDDCRILFRDVKPDNVGFYRRPRPRCACGHRDRRHDDRGGRRRRGTQVRREPGWVLQWREWGKEGEGRTPTVSSGDSVLSPAREERDRDASTSASRLEAGVGWHSYVYRVGSGMLARHLAQSRGVLPELEGKEAGETEPSRTYRDIDVLGKSATEVAAEIRASVGDAADQGAAFLCVAAFLPVRALHCD